MTERKVPLSVESVFKHKDEYLMWFAEALRVICGKSKKGNAIRSLVPEYVEIDFNGSIKPPRLYYPKKRPDTVVVQLPITKSCPKGSVCEHKLPLYSSVKGRIEVAIADEFAIRFKLLSENIKMNASSKKSTQKKSIKEIM